VLSKSPDHVPLFTGMPRSAVFRETEDARHPLDRLRTWSDHPPQENPIHSQPRACDSKMNPSGLDDMFRTDNFMMYGFKVALCNKQGRHPWGDCQYAHPTENARRRDPRVFSYSCVECPSYRCALETSCADCCTLAFACAPQSSTLSPLSWKQMAVHQFVSAQLLHSNAVAYTCGACTESNLQPQEQRLLHQGRPVRVLARRLRGPPAPRQLLHGRLQGRPAVPPQDLLLLPQQG
jgi:hypothetical protein